MSQRHILYNALNAVVYTRLFWMS